MIKLLIVSLHIQTTLLEQVELWSMINRRSFSFRRREVHSKEISNGNSLEATSIKARQSSKELKEK
jgi:hypothetical protein